MRLIEEAARAALEGELRTWPKPGLVSDADCGSHDDMSAATMRAGADAIAPFLGRMARAGRTADFSALQAIGIEAEAAMLAATGGVNTHRGAIFGLGLLCAALGARMPGERLGACVARRWGDAIAARPASLTSNGGRAAARHGTGGADAEAAGGFASVYGVGLPALRAAGPVECVFALIASVDDTNLLHRGGSAGAAFAREAARTFLAGGGANAEGWLVRAQAVHRAFVARRLSPGGCADLLAMTLFVDAVE